MLRNPYRQWGLWINGQGDHTWDKPLLLHHVGVIRPPTMTVADNPELAHSFYEAAEGQTDVISRMTAEGKEEAWRGWSAEDWANLLRKWKNDYPYAHHLRWQIFNEPAIDAKPYEEKAKYKAEMTELVNRLIYILNVARGLDMKVSLAGWASASIPWEALFEWRLLDPLFETMAETSEPIVGHDYMLHPVSDIAVGRPGEFTPNTLFTPEQCDPRFWATKAEVAEYWKTNYLGFRTTWMAERARQIGCELPVISQEGPFDKMPNLDASPWFIYDRLMQHYAISPKPYDSLKGVMSLKPLWEKLHPDWMAGPDGHANTTLNFMRYIAEVAPDYYIGHTLWCVNHNKDDWDLKYGMSVSRLGERFFELWQQAALDWDKAHETPAPTPPPIEIVPPSPLGIGVKAVNPTPTSRNIRSVPSLEGVELGQIAQDIAFIYYQATRLDSENLVWMWVECGEVAGWCANVQQFSAPVPAPSPDGPPDSGTTETRLKQLEMDNKLLWENVRQLRATNAEIYALLTKIGAAFADSPIRSQEKE
ncbi:MAG: hypothetical protein KC496_04740 [Anaerolineae bacterium]|nr:hypothetical protein [Anaerolineae bacterium]